MSWKSLIKFTLLLRNKVDYFTDRYGERKEETEKQAGEIISQSISSPSN